MIDMDESVEISELKFERRADTLLFDHVGTPLDNLEPVIQLPLVIIGQVQNEPIMEIKGARFGHRISPSALRRWKWLRGDSPAGNQCAPIGRSRRSDGPPQSPACYRARVSARSASG